MTSSSNWAGVDILSAHQQPVDTGDQLQGRCSTHGLAEPCDEAGQGGGGSRRRLSRAARIAG
ncbi:hypothetical protein [Nonomuraea aurantiaca]|uniref:hypothetical protein n=1 Tax=Nonomuraea aurantiaca TaxID=2878562 RepID=UPI001CD98BC2|nr:hypothetical protein [Nonomuraea aurantiaca]MCA2223037.1 hypothetical protein [Nonomuraea aurantiaca]